MNSLVVFGNSLLSGFGAGVGRYLNFDYTAGGTSGTGAAGYGIWDNAGTIEFKNSGGSWTACIGTATVPDCATGKFLTKQGGVFSCQ